MKKESQKRKEAKKQEKAMAKQEKAVARKTLEVTRKQDKAKVIALQRHSETSEMPCQVA